MTELPKRTARSNKPTTPEDFPTQPPPPSDDYSYTLEIVMNMQLTMGKLMEAVEGLKGESKDHRSDLNNIEKEIHGAKVTFRVLGVLFLAFYALAGWAVTTYIAATHK